MNIRTITTPLILGLGIACLLTSCGREKDTATAPPPPQAASESLLKVFAAEPSGEPASIHKARTTAKPGDLLTLQGRVMGSRRPFVDGRAVFILGDPEKLTPCNEDPEDTCKTPWDTCCDTAEDIKAGTATIQVVDADGRVLMEPIENVQGLGKLSTVIVSGRVADGSHAGLLLLEATSIKVIE